MWKGMHLPGQETSKNAGPSRGSQTRGASLGRAGPGAQGAARAARPGSRRGLGGERPKSVLTLRPTPGPRDFSWVFRLFAFPAGLGPRGFCLEPQPVESEGGGAAPGRDARRSPPSSQGGAAPQLPAGPPRKASALPSRLEQASGKPANLTTPPVMRPTRTARSAR